MTTATAGPPRATRNGAPDAYGTKGQGWVLFAGIMLAIVSVLNVIWGIAAIADSHFFVHNTHYILSSLSTWGWVTLFVGVVQGIAAASIWSGGKFGRWVGIGVASLSAIAALMTIPAYPFWALAVFAVDVLVIYGLAAYGGDRTIAV